MAFSTRARLPGVMENVLALVRQNLLANADQLIKLLSINFTTAPESKGIVDAIIEQLLLTETV